MYKVWELRSIVDNEAVWHVEAIHNVQGLAPLIVSVLLLELFYKLLTPLVPQRHEQDVDTFLVLLVRLDDLVQIIFL